MNPGTEKAADKAARHFTHGTSAATADQAAEGAVRPEDKHIDTPVAREAEPLPENRKHDQLADKEAAAEDRQEALLDEGLEETFPSSDPVSVKRIT
jgi:hypothetical protein